MSIILKIIILIKFYILLKPKSQNIYLSNKYINNIILLF